MKTCVSLVCASLVALSADAKLKTLMLPCVPDGVETYYLPLDEQGADGSTLRLKSRRGEDIPFSFDARLEIPARAGLVRRPVDGWYSGYDFPASEDACRRYGWISFRTPPGVKEVLLSFDAGAGKCSQERPDPALRPWWISLFRHPVIADESVGVAVDGAFRIRTNQFVDISQMSGRRVVSLLRACAGGEDSRSCNFSISLNGASGEGKRVTGGYFKAAPEGVDRITEGFMRAGVTPSFTSSNGALFAVGRKDASSGPVTLKLFRVQAAPFVRYDGVKIESDLYNVGDFVRILLPRTRGDVLVPYSAEGISGERVVHIGEDSRISADYELRMRSGQLVRAGKGESVSLERVSLGRYVLRVTVCVDGRNLCTANLRFAVQSGPQW